MLKFKSAILFFSFVGISTIILSILFDSRAILLSSTLSLIIIIWWKNIKIILLWIALLISCLFIYKIDSTKGRLFIYINSFELFRENFPKGLGLGQYQRDYLKQQALFFRENDFFDRNSYFYLSDDTRFAFNDYLELSCETGIIGVILLFLFFIAVKEIIVTKIDDTEGLLAKYIFLCFLLAAFITHVFERPYICAISFFTYLYLIRSVKSPTLAIIKLPLAYFILLMSMYLIYSQLYNSQRINKSKYYILTGQYVLAIKELDILIQKNECDELCLFEYAKIKFLHRDYQSSELMMKNIIKKYSSSLYYSLLAESQFKLAKYQESIENYMLAINMVPNRFEPRIGLLYVYKEIGDIQNEKKIKNEISEMKVKVTTNRTNYIKNNINSL